MLKRKKIIANLLATTMIASTLVVNASALETRATVSVSTIAGKTRQDTAVKVSEAMGKTSTHAVIINGNEGLTDALTATPYASLKNAPILITYKEKLTAETKARLTVLGVKTVDIIGGESVVQPAVENELKAMGITVNRISGSNRYKTAAAVAEAIDKISDVKQVAVVNGATGLPDAVSIAAPAADNKMPILLASPNSGLADSQDFIKVQSITKSYVIGQTKAVSDSTMNTLPGTKVRLGGSTRQETNAKVISQFYTTSSFSNIYVTKSGQVNKEDEVVDALAVGVLAAKDDVPVMIVGKSLHSSQETLLKNKSFAKITQVGNGVPSASINAIKATQEDPEAKVTGVTLVDYKTIKLTGTELSRIDKYKVSMSGNTVSSYTVNSSGTEATVEFVNAFNSGTNTISVTSNLGKTTTHTFTYNAEISSVQATTKEVALEGIQYLEFTVNGSQKRSIKELEAAGWKVEFKSSKNVFYNENDPTTPLKSSKTGKLVSNLAQSPLPNLATGDVFDYEIALTKGSQIIKTGEKKSVTISNTATNLSKIDSYDMAFNNRAGENNTFKSNKLLVGETILISGIKGLLNNGTKPDITSSTIVTSSDATVLSVTGKTITARKTGIATLTLEKDNIKTSVTIQVLDPSTNARVVNNVKYYVNNNQVSSLNLTKSLDSSTYYTKTVEARATDQHGDPINAGATLVSDIKTTSTTPVKVAEASTTSFTNGVATITITSTEQTGTGVLKMERVNANSTVTTVGSMNVIVASATANKLTYTLDRVSGSIDNKMDRYKYKADDTLTLSVNSFDSNGVSQEPINISNTFDYIIKGYDSDLVTVSRSGTDIIIVPTSDKTKTGTTTISLYKKNGTKEELMKSVSIEIIDTTPVIESIELKTISDITKINSSISDPEFNLIDLFKIDYTKIANPSVGGSVNINDETQYKKVVEGIKVKGYENQEVILSISSAGGGDAILFIDRDNDGVYDVQGDTTGDFILATFKIELSTATGVVSGATVKLNSATQNGSIIVGRYDGVYSSNKVPKDIVVNVRIPR